MKKRLWQRLLKTDRYTLHQAKGEPQTFSVRWLKKSSASGLPVYGERIFPAPNIESAIQQAPFVTGFEVVKKAEIIPLDQAFDMALQQSRRRDRARRDWNHAVKSFSDWLVGHYPDCGDWNQLARQIVREYAQNFAGKGDNYARLRLQPIRQTSAFMAREYGFPDVAEGIATSNKLKTPPAEVLIADVFGFLDYLQEKRPEYEAPAALQALAGLQLQEATRLTWDRIDLKRGLVEISGEVKNEYRERLIPIPLRAGEALLRHSQLKVQDIHGHLVTEDYFNYSTAISHAIRSFNPRLAWQPKDLRNTILQFALRSNLHNDIWEQYVGHRSRNITGLHYMSRLASPSAAHREESDKRMQVFRDQVIAPIDTAYGEYRGKQRAHQRGRKTS